MSERVGVRDCERESVSERGRVRVMVRVVERV